MVACSTSRSVTRNFSDVGTDSLNLMHFATIFHIIGGKPTWNWGCMPPVVGKWSNILWLDVGRRSELNKILLRMILSDSYCRCYFFGCQNWYGDHKELFRRPRRHILKWLSWRFPIYAIPMCSKENHTYSISTSAGLTQSAGKQMRNNYCTWVYQSVATYLWSGDAIKIYVLGLPSWAISTFYPPLIRNSFNKRSSSSDIESITDGPLS